MSIPMTWTFLGKTNDGYRVYDRGDSHFHPEGGLTLEILKEGLRKIRFSKGGDFQKHELCFKRNIGYTTCVETTNDDQIVFVYRKGREGQTPMVKNREPEESSDLTIILRKDENMVNHLTLITAFIGAGSTPEPWDRRLRKNPKAKREAENFWNSHALIYNEELVDWERTTA